MFILIVILLFIIPLLFSVQVKAQSTTSGDIQSGRGVIIVNNIAYMDSTVIMTIQRATDSIVALKALITAMGTKTDTLFTCSLNSRVRLSTTKNFLVSLYVNISVLSALTGVNSGSIKLQRSPDNSAWTDLTAASIVSNVGVLSTQVNTQIVSGLIPAGYYYRIVTASAGVNGGTFTPLLSNAISQ